MEHDGKRHALVSVTTRRNDVSITPKSAVSGRKIDD